jgi:hypothetical protein
MPFDVPFAEMLGVAPGYPNACEVCDDGAVANFALVTGKALMESPTAP